MGDVKELSNRLSMFLENPSFLNSPEILNAKKQLINTEFNWDVIAKRTAEVYREIARPTADGGKNKGGQETKDKGADVFASNLKRSAPQT
jgi:hypothetical protein